MDKLANFKILLSKERLESYNNEIDKHYENLKLIANITPKIATLEIILRNKLDSVLSLRNNEWIKNAKDAKIIEAREKIENNSNGGLPISSSIPFSHELRDYNPYYKKRKIPK